MRNNLSTSGQFRQQEQGQLTSADVSYQVVGLCECYFKPNQMFQFDTEHPVCFLDVLKFISHS